MTQLITSFGDEFRYYITDAVGNYYRADIDPLTGLRRVIADNQKKPLEFTPDGWQAKSIEFQRDLESSEAVRSFSLSLNFVRDGAEIIRWIYSYKGWDAEAFLVIEKLNHDTLLYETYYRGTIDFTSYNDKKGDWRVEVHISDDSYALEIGNKEKNKVEIPFDPSYSHVVALEGIALENRFEAVITNGEGEVDINNDHIVAVQILNEELSSGVTINDTERKRETNANWHRLFEDAPPLIVTRTETDVEVEYNFGYRLRVNGYTPPPGFFFVVQLVELALDFRSIIGVETLDMISPTVMNNWYVREAGRRFTYHKQAGTALFIMGRYSSTGVYQSNTDVDYLSSPDYFFRAKVKDKYKRTYADCIEFGDLFLQVQKRLSPDLDVHLSLLSKPTNYRLFVTSGDAIRRVPDAKISVSLDELFKAYNALYCVGKEVKPNNTIRIMPREQMYDAQVRIFDIGEVKDLRISNADDLCYQGFDTGYNADTYDDINGRFEYNNESRFTMECKHTEKRYNNISPIRADVMGIEFTRIEGATTKDTTRDNSLFFILVNTVPTLQFGIFEVWRNPADVLDNTGFPDNARAYNLDITPKRNIKRHEGWLRPGWRWYSGRRVKFDTSDKDFNLSINGGMHQELTDMRVSDFALDKSIFLPYYFEFETEVPTDFLPIMDLLKNGYIEFSFGERTYKGFVISCSVQPATNGAQSWKLLAHPETSIED